MSFNKMSNWSIITLVQSFTSLVHTWLYENNIQFCGFNYAHFDFKQRPMHFSLHWMFRIGVYIGSSIYGMTYIISFINCIENGKMLTYKMLQSLVVGLKTIDDCHQSFFFLQVNSVIAGAVAGAAVAAGTRSWPQVVWMAGLVSAFSAAADYSKTF